ncbi:MAG: hypothetical protein O9297_07905 [Flavobacterium sp.]|uniref:hypothetical protein n=2 Tax=Flavobacterium sp. TaxID=239 RepID=UPI0022C28E4D|nr:hypothetical protein [Flavobacterium sp.]MCZ8297127.1 hypothetical protein [Flavobacterium sp.]
MKTKIKLLARLLMATVLFSFIGCSEDVYENFSNEKANAINFKKVNFSEFKKNRLALQRFTEVENNWSSNQRGIYLEDYGVYIDTTNIIYIEKDDVNSYTFKIINNDATNKVENLVLNSKENGNYEAFISEYLLTQQDISYLSESNNTLLQKSPSAITNIENSQRQSISSECISFEEVNRTYCRNSEGNVIRTQGDLGDGCVGMSWTETVTVVTIDASCLTSGGGFTGNMGNGGFNGYSNNGFYNGDNGNSPGYPGGAGNNNTAGNNPPYSSTNDPLGDSALLTTPIFAIDRIEAQIINFLNESQAYWWYNFATNEFKAEVRNYLNENTFNTNSKIIIKEIISQIVLSQYTFTSIKPFLIEKQIDATQLDPCSSGVFQQVKNTTNNDFVTLLAKLDANGSVYNTTIKTETLPNGNTNPAATIRTSAYNYTIYISPEYEGKTKLFIASLQLHELLHAYFLSLIDDCFIQNNCQLLATFPELWEYYVSVCDNQYPSNQLSHHEQIANKYVSAIANALQEFQPGLPQQVYDDLAWSGLEGTNVFNTLHPIGSSSRQRILNRKAAEQSGHPIAEGTPQEQINYGQPCN